jgi:Rps23 Pro-64 3,4-dihydroxylase Tpa1-like proline 4-hydroxylase
VGRLKTQLADLGFCEFPDALGREKFERLRREAIDQFDHAFFSESRDGLVYEAYIADFGPEAKAYLGSPDMQDLLTGLIGRPYALDAGKSCFTYYLEGGFLEPHLDDIAGEEPLSVLTYLWAGSDDPARHDSGLKLNLYQAGNEPSFVFQTREASLLIGFGTRVRHGRPRLRASEKVIVINGSFAAR